MCGSSAVPPRFLDAESHRFDIQAIGDGEMDGGMNVPEASKNVPGAAREGTLCACEPGQSPTREEHMSATE